MSSDIATVGSGSNKQRCGHGSVGILGRAGGVAALLLLLFYISSFNYHYSHTNSLDVPFMIRWWATSSPGYATTTAVTSLTAATKAEPPTNLSHLVFGLVSSAKTWGHRKPYVESWWRPNVTRGFLFFDKFPENDSLFCPTTCPPFLINEDFTRWEIYPKIKAPLQVRMVRSIIETFRQQNHGVRWYVMADDDSVLFVDNILEVLSKYDHTKYFYLGSQGSESILSNAYLSFDMGFGGAGFALSYPLVAALSKKLDGCIKRYPYLWSADYYTYICIADLGVALSPQKGFHQIDLRGDLSGFLSSHPQSPLLSLHHINVVDPIFPNMTRAEAIHHLNKPAKLDQSRLLQQFICYHHEKNWSVSVSWGYSAHMYESIFSRVSLHSPIETFGPWSRNAKPPRFMFNTRWVTNNSCETPHEFFFDSIEVKDVGDPSIVTTYKRARTRGLGACSATGNHSADGINKIRVFSPVKRQLEDGRIECCDMAMADEKTTTVTLRPCMEAEEIV